MDSVEAYFSHMNADEFDDLALQFSTDAEVSVPGAPTVRGRQAIRELYSRIFRPWVEHHDDPVRVVSAGATVTVNVRFSGVLDNGHRSEFDAVDVFDLDEAGRIARLTNWYDSHAVRKELAANRSAGTPGELEPLRTRLNALGICSELRLECVELRHETARVTMEVDQGVLHRSGAVPGALIAALADVAASFSLHTVISPSDLHVTSELTTHFLAPALAPPLSAEGRVVRAGRRQAVASVKVRDSAEGLCALATGSWAITADSPYSLMRDEPAGTASELR